MSCATQTQKGSPASATAASIRRRHDAQQSACSMLASLAVAAVAAAAGRVCVHRSAAGLGTDGDAAAVRRRGDEQHLVSGVEVLQPQCHERRVCDDLPGGCERERGSVGRRRLRRHSGWSTYLVSDSLNIPAAAGGRDIIIGVHAYAEGTYRLTATASFTAAVRRLAYELGTVAQGTQGYLYYFVPAPSGSEDVILTLRMTSTSVVDLHARNNADMSASTAFTWSSTQPLNTVERILMSSPAAVGIIVAVYVASPAADFTLTAERRTHLPLLTASTPVSVSGGSAAPSLFYFTADGSSSFVLSVTAEYPASTQILITTPTSLYTTVGADSSDASTPMGVSSLEISGQLLMAGTYSIAVLTAPGTAVNSLSIRVTTMPLSPASGSYLTLSPSSLQSVSLSGAGSQSFNSLSVDLPAGVSTDLTVTLQAQQGDARLFVRHIDSAAWQAMSSAPTAGGSIGSSVVLPSITGGSYVIGVWMLSDNATLTLAAVVQSASPQLLLSDSRSIWTYDGHPTYLYLDLLSARHAVTLSISDTSLTDTVIYVSTPASTSSDGYPRPSNSSRDAMLTATDGHLTLSGALLMPGRYWLAFETLRQSALVQLTVTAGTFQGMLTSSRPSFGQLRPEYPSALWSCLVPKGQGAAFILMAPADAIRASQLLLTVGSSVAPPTSAPGGLRVLAEPAAYGADRLRVDRSAEDTAECMRLAWPPRSDGCLYTLEISGLSFADGSIIRWIGSDRSALLSIDYTLFAALSEDSAAIESIELADATSVVELTFDASAAVTRTLLPGRTHHFAVMQNAGVAALASQAHLRVDLQSASDIIRADSLGVYLSLNASHSEPRSAGLAHFDFVLPVYSQSQLRLTLASGATPATAFAVDAWRIVVKNRNPSSVTYSIRIGANDTQWDDSSAASQSRADISLLIALACAATLASFWR